jgi:hypothetical protein
MKKMLCDYKVFTSTFRTVRGVSVLIIFSTVLLASLVPNSNYVTYFKLKGESIVGMKYYGEGSYRDPLWAYYDDYGFVYIRFPYAASLLHIWTNISIGELAHLQANRLIIGVDVFAVKKFDNLVISLIGREAKTPDYIFSVSISAENIVGFKNHIFEIDEIEWIKKGLKENLYSLSEYQWSQPLQITIRAEDLEGNLVEGLAELRLSLEIGRQTFLFNLQGSITEESKGKIITELRYGKNLVPNFSFEEGTLLIPYGWNFSAWTQPAPQFFWTTELARSGIHSLKIGTQYEVRAAWHNSHKWNISAGNVYQGVAWIKTENVSGLGSFVAIAWFDVDDNWISTVVSAPVKGTNDWQVSEVIGIAPPDARRARLELWLEGSGSVWFDDVYFRRVEKIVTVNGTLSNWSG